MRSSSANPYAPDRNHRTPIGCRHRLCLSPLAYGAPKVVLRAKKTETAISGKGPKSQIRNRCVILVGNPVLFLGLPFSVRETSSAPLSFNHRHTNELPLPSQHTVPRRGNPSPVLRSIGGGGGSDCTGSGNGSFYPIHGGREAALTMAAIFSAASPPDLFRFLLLHRDGAGLASSAFIRCPEPAHWSLLSH